MAKSCLFVVLLNFMMMFVAKEASATWAEVTLLSGEWQDWKLTLKKISQKQSLMQESKMEYRRKTERGVGFGFPSFIPKFQIKDENQNNQLSRSKSTQYKRVDATEIPRIFLMASASIEGKSYNVTSRPVQGHVAQWRDKFIINIEQLKDEFITFEISVFIPAHQRYFFIGSKTIAVKELVITHLPQG